MRGGQNAWAKRENPLNWFTSRRKIQGSRSRICGGESFEKKKNGVKLNTVQRLSKKIETLKDAGAGASHARWGRRTDCGANLTATVKKEGSKRGRREQVIQWGRSQSNSSRSSIISTEGGEEIRYPLLTMVTYSERRRVFFKRKPVSFPARKVIKHCKDGGDHPETSTQSPRRQKASLAFIQRRPEKGW